METLSQDLRYAVRRLARSRGFTSVAILTMALGIGANTAIFSIVNTVLFRPLPVEKLEELVDLYTDDSKGVPIVSSYPDFLEFRKQTSLFNGAAAYKPGIFNLSEKGGSEILYGEYVSADYFSVLGVPVVRGRSFLPEEDRQGAPPAAILGHGFWQGRFGGDPGITGRTISINGHKVLVVGIISPKFKGAFLGLSADLWLPLTAEPQIMPQAGNDLDSRGSRSLFVKGRLRPGVSLDQANAGLAVLAGQLSKAYPESNAGRKMSAVPTSDVRFHPAVDRNLVPVAALLMAIPALVLLIACSNVANLLLARASSRHKEIAVRLALGAPRRRILRQLLTESTLLALAGGAVGLLLAYWVVSALEKFQPPIPIPVALDLAIDPRVLVFTLALSILTGVAFGLAPALQITRADLIPALKDEAVFTPRAYRRFGLRNVLVVAQVSVSLILLIGAGLFVRSLQKAQSIDLGFEGHKALIFTPGLFFTDITEAQSRAFYERLSERLAALPGAETVALASRIPLGAQVHVNAFYPDGAEIDEKKAPEVDVTTVDAAYFSVLGVPLVAGRPFSAADGPSSPKVAIISEATARRFWPGRDAVGRTFRIGRKSEELLQIVGVAKDTRVRTLGEAPRPYVYFPYTQRDPLGMSVVLRTAGDPAPLIAAVRREVQAIDPSLPIMELHTMEDHLRLMMFPPRAGAAILTLFGSLALLLATLGLYGVVAYSVSQRTREIGIRMALGAGRREVLAMVIRQGMILVGVGIALGLAAATVAVRPLSTFLYGVGAGDPPTFAALAAVLASVAFVASYVPARRATRVEPVTALRRYE